MIVLFRDSSVNYWLNNSVVDCGNVDAPNSNLEIVFPHDNDYKMIAKQIQENDENEKKNSDISNYNRPPSKGYKKKYNNTTNVTNNSIEDAKGYRINNKKFEPVYYKKKYNNTSNNSIKDAYIHPQEGYRKNTKTNNKKFEPVYYHE